MSTNKQNKNNTTNTVNNIISATDENIIKTVLPKANINVNKSSKTFMFNKKNYTFMLIGLAVIILGFILMAGGKSADPHVFNRDEIYSFRRIKLAPTLVMLGFIIEVFAIMRIPKEGE